MAIKSLGKGRWQVRVARVNRKTGKRDDLRAVVSGPRSAAEAKEREFEAELAGGGRRQRQQLSTYARSWAAARADTLKPSVRAKYGNSLALHILPALGDYYLDAITPGDVQRYVTDRVGAGAAGNTVLNELRLIRTIAADSVADGAAERNWAARVKPPKVSAYTEERPNLLTAPQLAQVLAAVPARWRSLVTLMATTGLRWGEASALRWDDIERWPDATPAAARRPWDAVGQIKVRRSNWRGAAVTTKTAKSLRTVTLLREVAELLGPPRRATSPWLFPSGEGDLYRGTPLVAVLDRVAVKLGWAAWEGPATDRKAVGFRITPHGLRRTWNDLARQRGDRLVVQAMSGHVTDAMTDHYSLVRADEKAKLASSVRAALEPPKDDEETT
jgi:integrase